MTHREIVQSRRDLRHESQGMTLSKTRSTITARVILDVVVGVCCVKSSATGWGGTGPPRAGTAHAVFFRRLVYGEVFKSIGTLERVFACES